MKLYVVIKRGGKFTAGLIDGTITFYIDTISLKGIKFIPYSEITSKNQIKDPEDFLTDYAWMSGALEDLFGDDLPKPNIVKNYDEVDYNPGEICDYIIDMLNLTFGDFMWINKKSVLVA